MSTFTSCIPPRKEIVTQAKRYLEVENKWNGSAKEDGAKKWKHIRDRYGKLELEYSNHPLAGDKTGSSGEIKSFAHKILNELSMQTIGKPFDPYLPVSLNEYNRLNMRIDRLNREIGNGKLSWFDTIWKPKQAIANRYPEIAYMVNKLSKAANFERTQNIEYVTGIDNVSKHLTAALLEADAITRGDVAMMKVGKSNPHLKKLDELWEGLILARYTGDTKKMKEVNDKLSKVVNDEGDAVIKKLLDYVEKDIKVDKEGKRISVNIINAGDGIRDFFNVMGGVAVNGLKESSNTLSILYFGKETPTDLQLATPLGKRWSLLDKKIKDTIDSINEKREVNTKKGLAKKLKEDPTYEFEGYFPHYLITEFGKLRDVINKNIKSESEVTELWSKAEKLPTEKRLELLEEVDSIISSFENPGKLRHTRGRLISDGLDNAWQKNPIGVMKRYAQDAIAFNKIHHVKSAYLKVIRNIKGSVSADIDFGRRMREYIDGIYSTATRGYADRDPMVNGIVRAITAAEFASKLGLGVTSAVRNFLSANHYLAAVGYKTWNQAMQSYRKNENGIADMINKIESKQGFKFKEANLAAITEGLLPSTGVDRKSIDYNEYTEEITFMHKGVAKSIDKATAKATGFLAKFHAFGENVIRKNMFRTSWIMTYKALKESPEFLATRKRGEQELIDIATNAALVTVNTYAYEYAAFAKAPAIGGTTKNFGAAGQVLGQFMHYPMSFLTQQVNMLRKAGESVAVGDYKSPEVLASIRYAGVYAFIHLLSGAINLDLTHLFENDTANRIRDMVEFLAAETDEEREKVFHGGGPITQFVGGPAVSDAIFYGNYLGLYRMPENDFAQLIFGYSDMYEKTDKEKKERLLSTLSVQAGKMINKDWPAITSANAEEVLRHELGLYPRAWTRKDFYEKPWGLGRWFGERYKKIPGKRRRKPVYPYQMRQKNISASNKELKKLYEAMGI